MRTIGIDEYVFPQYIQTSRRTITVLGQFDPADGKVTAYDKFLGCRMPFQKNKGYVDTAGYIWIYVEQKPERNANLYPYFWVDYDGVKHFSSPKEETQKEFHVSRLIALDMETIATKSDANKVYYNEDELNDLNNASAIYKPIEMQDDDFLKKLIKKAILKKRIDIARLKSRTSESYSIPNMKAALQGKTRMSVGYFIIWAELLGLDFTVTLTDNGTDYVNPLMSPIVYRSYTDTAMTQEEIDAEEEAKKKRKERRNHD